ncbi:MAG: sulfotransferase family 2 domain-containing protein [Planctomycetaceae bacterium]
MIVDRKWIGDAAHRAQASDGDQPLSIREDRLKTFEYRWPEGEYFVSWNRKAVYCPIPKVACSALKMWWAELERQDLTDFSYRCERGKLCAEHGRLNESFKLYQPNREFTYEPMTDGGWFRFAFVRNPWARLASSFVNKFAYPSSHALNFFALQKRKQLQREHDTIATEAVTVQAAPDLWQPEFSFRDFVEALAESNLDTDSIAEIDLHWLPQYRFLGTTPFDFIGRFETLLPDLNYVCDRLALPAPTLKDVNRTDYDNQVKEAVHFSELPIQRMGELLVLPPWRHFYTPRLVRLVSEIYHEDIKRFGYGFSVE